MGQESEISTATFFLFVISFLSEMLEMLTAPIGQSVAVTWRQG